MSGKDLLICLLIIILFGIYCFARIIANAMQYRITDRKWYYLLIGSIIGIIVLLIVYTGDFLGVMFLVFVLIVYIVLKIAI